MLPHVKADHRYALDINNTVHEWVIFVVGLSDEHAAIGADAEPDPAWNDPAAGSLSESLLEAREVCEVLRDRVGQRTNWFVLSVINSTTKLAEKEQMVVDTPEGQSLGWFIESCRLHVLRKLNLVEFLILLHHPNQESTSVSGSYGKVSLGKIGRHKKAVSHLLGLLSLTLRCRREAPHQRACPAQPI